MEIKKLLEQRRIIKKRKPKFLRKDWHKVSNLGLRRENKQVWRKPKGRHNKMREKKKSHLKLPSIGYRSPALIRGSINGLVPILVKNESDLERVRAENIVIIANVGLKKKISIIKKAREMNINLSVSKKFLRNIEKRIAEINARKDRGKGTEKTAEAGKKEEKKEGAAGQEQKNAT